MIKEGWELLAKKINPNYFEDFIKFHNEEAKKYEEDSDTNNN